MGTKKYMHQCIDDIFALVHISPIEAHSAEKGLRASGNRNALSQSAQYNLTENVG